MLGVCQTKVLTSTSVCIYPPTYKQTNKHVSSREGSRLCDGLAPAHTSVSWIFFVYANILLSFILLHYVSVEFVLCFFCVFYCFTVFFLAITELIFHKFPIDPVAFVLDVS